MKVRLKSERRSDYEDLSPKKMYEVIGFEIEYLRVANDEGRPYLYPKEIFEVVDGDIPGDWVVREEGHGESYGYPQELSEVGFFERYFEDEEEAMRIFQDVVKKR